MENVAIAMMHVTIRPYEDEDEAQVIALWRDCNLIVPWNDPERDIALKRAIQPELFLVGVIEERVIATAMAGYEGHRGWLNYVAVAPQHQRQGVGRRIVEAAVARMQAMGCPKVNLQVRDTNRAVIEFYERLGFQVEKVVGMGRRLDSAAP
jgi:ribosomal protein S18 acetylase RimI-like enzyme